MSYHRYGLAAMPDPPVPSGVDPELAREVARCQ
jgi:hypothetical protein